MNFNNLTVYVDYRFSAGNSQPTQKYLRARIKVGACLGTDLTRQWITDYEQIQRDALATLAKSIVNCDNVFFELDPLLVNRGLTPCRYQLKDGIATLKTA